MNRLSLCLLFAFGIAGCRGESAPTPSGAVAQESPREGNAPRNSDQPASGSRSKQPAPSPAAKTVEELGRKVFDAIKRDDQEAYLDTAMPEHAAEHYIVAQQSRMDNEGDPEKKQKMIDRFEEFKSRMRTHLRTLRGRFEKKWKTEIIGKATGLGIEWEKAELVDVITGGEKQVAPGIVRHAAMAIQFRCRGKSFTLFIDDPTKIDGNWYFFDPPLSITVGLKT